MPRAAPTSRISTSARASRNACASASAGMRCPPVPPPAMITFTALPPTQRGMPSAECEMDRTIVEPDLDPCGSTLALQFRIPQLAFRIVHLALRPSAYGSPPRDADQHPGHDQRDEQARAPE